MQIEPIQTVAAMPPRPRAGHKGLFGRVLVVAGSHDMIGAPALAGEAALRCGAGLVQVASPRAILAAVLTVTPELTGLGLPETGGMDGLVEAAGKAHALILGPGMGQGAAAKQRILRLIRLEKPAVVDADALNILSAQRRWPATFSMRAVLTPHPGEMSRLAPLLGCQGPVPPDDRGRKALATRAARACGQVVLLKGHRTVVADGRRVYVNHTGDSSLSKAGSGDVLAGILGCLLAQGMEPFDAACLAAHLHGRAGELAGAAMGRRCALARDVIAWLPKAIRQHERGR